MIDDDTSRLAKQRTYTIPYESRTFNCDVYGLWILSLRVTTTII